MYYFHDKIDSVIPKKLPTPSEMNLIISGSRVGGERSDVIIWMRAWIKKYGPPKCVYVGDCPTGVDRLVEEFCIQNFIPLRTFYADWSRYGPAGGPRRNQSMIDCAKAEDFFMALPGARSRGTWDCLQRAQVKIKNILVCRKLPTSRDYENEPRKSAKRRRT